MPTKRGKSVRDRGVEFEALLELRGSWAALEMAIACSGDGLKSVKVLDAASEVQETLERFLERCDPKPEALAAVG